MTSTDLLMEALPARAFPARWLALEHDGYRLGYRAWDGGVWRCLFVLTPTPQHPEHRAAGEEE